MITTKTLVTQTLYTVEDIEEKFKQFIKENYPEFATKQVVVDINDTSGVPMSIRYSDDFVIHSYHGFNFLLYRALGLDPNTATHENVRIEDEEILAKSRCPNALIITQTTKL